MEKNLFEKIINKEIPSHIIYEDKNFIAILDAYPISQGHTLIIPKQKASNLLENDEQILFKINHLAKKLSLHLMNKLEASSIRWQTNIGPEAGQEIFHTHLHLIPFYKKEPKKLINQELEKKLII